MESRKFPKLGRFLLSPTKWIVPLLIETNGLVLLSSTTGRRTQWLPAMNGWRNFSQAKARDSVGTGREVRRKVIGEW